MRKEISSLFNIAIVGSLILGMSSKVALATTYTDSYSTPSFLSLSSAALYSEPVSSNLIGTTEDLLAANDYYVETDNEDYYAGYDTGFEEGHGEGYRKGRDEGYRAGYDEGYRKGYDEGHNVGYEEGKNDAAYSFE